MHLGVILILVVVGGGFIMGLRRRREINALRPPKSHWRQGHKLRYAATETKAQPIRRRTIRTMPLERDDLDDLDNMFAGDRPEDY